MKLLSCVRLFATHGHQHPPSRGFSRKEYWSELAFPSPGNFPTQGLNPGLPCCRQTLYHLFHLSVFLNIRFVRFIHTVTCSESLLYRTLLCALNSMISYTVDGYFSTFQVFHFVSLPNVLSSTSQKPLSRIVRINSMCIFSFGRYYQTSPKWFTISTHSSSGLEFIFSSILSIFHLFSF